MSKIMFEDLRIHTESTEDFKIKLDRLYTTQSCNDLVYIVEKLEDVASFTYRGIYLRANTTMFLTETGRISNNPADEPNLNFDLVARVTEVECNLPVTISGYFKEEDCAEVEFRLNDTGLNSVDLYCEESMVEVTNLIAATLKARYHYKSLEALLQ